MWNEKLGLCVNYIGLVTSKQKKLNLNELNVEMEKTKAKLLEFNRTSQPAPDVNIYYCNYDVL